MLRTTGDYRAPWEIDARPPLKMSESIYWQEFHPRESRFFSARVITEIIRGISKNKFRIVSFSDGDIFITCLFSYSLSRAERVSFFSLLCAFGGQKFCQVLHFIITDDSSWLDTWQITTAGCQLRRCVLSPASTFSPPKTTRLCCCCANETHYLRPERERRIFRRKLYTF